MSWSIFIEEPRETYRNSPYEVLAGLAVEDKNIWPLTRKLTDANLQYFGRQMTELNGIYMRANDLISAEVFDHAAISHNKIGFKDHKICSRDESTAVAQAKIAYSKFALGLARDYGARAFAVICLPNIDRSFIQHKLGKDYSFMLERFFSFLEYNRSVGYIFRSLENNVDSEVIVDYFNKTTKGRVRSRLIVPEPVLVRGYMDTIIQVTSIVAYSISWGFRLSNMSKPIRGDIAELADITKSLRFMFLAENGQKDWSFKYINDLRPSD